jgi:hypothetical protein
MLHLKVCEKYLLKLIKQIIDSRLEYLVLSALAFEWADSYDQKARNIYTITKTSG